MRVIFLDHDGVVCLVQQWGGRTRKQTEWNRLNPDNTVYYEYDYNKMDVEYRFDDFDEKSVRVLNQIIKDTDAEIVVSSDWRHSCTLEEMQDLYRKFGVIKSPIDYTPQLDNEDFKREDLVTPNWSGIRIPLGYEAERAMEIKKWLLINKVDSWVAVDDLNMESYLDNFVHTKRMNEGIKQSGVKQKIIKYLNV